MLAAASCSIDVCHRVMQAAPNVNKQDNIGRTALHIACKAGRLQVVQLLTQCEDLDPDLRSCGGDTPLMYSVLSQQKELVCFCLENQFNPFLYNSVKQTARDYAATYTKGSEIVELIDQAI